MGLARPHELQPNQPLYEPPFWALQWGDEFDACPDGRPDPQKWAYEVGQLRNNELQYYRPDNAKCVDGKLVITAMHHDPGLPLPDSERKCKDPNLKGPWC